MAFRRWGDMSAASHPAHARGDHAGGSNTNREAERGFDEAPKRRRDGERKWSDAAAFLRAPAPMHAISAGGVLIAVNDAWLRAFGYDRETVLGAPLSALIVDGDCGQTPPIPTGFWRDGRCEKHALRLRAKCGAVVDVEANGVVERDGDDLRGVFALADVTAREGALRENERLKARDAALERRVHALELFAYAAAHDLQAPARAARGYAEILASEHAGALSSDGAACVAAIARAAERMDGLVVALADFARAPEIAARAATALSSVVDASLSACEDVIAEADASVIVTPLPTAACDPSTTALLFENLIANAVKHRDPRRPLVIEIGTRGTATQREVFVRDNGLGVPPEHSERVFEPFTRVGGRRAVDGAGLGLAICRRVCAAHGWSIRVDASRSVGCEVVVGLGSDLSRRDGRG